MNAAELHGLGIVDDRGAVIIALVDAGYSQPQAIKLLDTLILAGRPAAPRAWTQNELHLLGQALLHSDGKLPRQSQLRELATLCQRTPKAVSSQLERMIRARAQGTV